MIPCEAFLTKMLEWLAISFSISFDRWDHIASMYLGLGFNSWISVFPTSGLVSLSCPWFTYTLAKHLIKNLMLLCGKDGDSNVIRCIPIGRKARNKELLTIWQEVSMWVPKGSALDPVLLTILLMTWMKGLDGKTARFSDITKPGRMVNILNDGSIIHKDLERLQHWTESKKRWNSVGVNVKAYTLQKISIACIIWGRND